MKYVQVSRGKDRKGVGLLHRVIAERALGKPLRLSAPVHHVNSDPKDNRHSNLVMCDSHSYHKLLHTRTRIVKLGGNPNTQRICTDCRLLRDLGDMGKNRDQRTNQCKACLCTRLKLHRLRNLERLRAYDRARNQLPARKEQMNRHAAEFRARQLEHCSLHAEHS